MHTGDDTAEFSKDKIEWTRILFQQKLLERAQKNAGLLSSDELNKVIIDM